MVLCNVLSSLWKKHVFGFIKENLIIESTFTQQTSNSENLWKAQLGMTKNYLICLRCSIDYLFLEESDQHNKQKDFNLLMNIVPVCHLRVKKHGKRKLEILFPSGNICYFKLLISPGCGKAWSHWRTLEQISERDLLPFLPRSKLISFSELDTDIQRTLTNQNFNVCFISLQKYLEQDKCSDTATSSTVTDSSRSAARQMIHRQKPELNSSHGNTKTTVQETRSRNTTMIRKQIRRFGEGVSENCMFPLTLTNFYRLTANGTIQYGGNRLEKHSITQGKSFNPLKGNKKDQREREDISGMMYVSSTTEHEEGKYLGNHAQNIFKATHFFTNVSLLVIPGGLRMSKSVDSLLEIPVKLSDADSLKTNVSLPNVNELALYRRYHRLSYETDHFPERSKSCNSTNNILFWLPSEKLNGRMYCNSPICHKILADEKKRTLTRKGQLHQDFLQLNFKFHARDDDNSKHPRQMMSARQKYVSNGKKKHLKSAKLPGVSVINHSSTDSIEFSRETKTKRKKLQAARNRPMSARISPKSKKLEPYAVAHALKRIQQRMFSEIETSEIARYILKPHSVTEVNCPLLCGYIFFFERLKSIVNAELKAQKSMKDSVEIYLLFLQEYFPTFFALLEKNYWAEKQTTSILSGFHHFFSRSYNQRSTKIGKSFT